LQAPLQNRRAQLEKKKFAYQFLRDVEDEKLWILERLPLARSGDLGDSLFNCHALQKKNQVRKTSHVFFRHSRTVVHSRRIESNREIIENSSLF
jgi:hypothetical protein